MEHGFCNKECVELSQRYGNAGIMGGKGEPAWLNWPLNLESKKSEENILKQNTIALKRKLRKPQ